MIRLACQGSGVCRRRSVTGAPHRDEHLLRDEHADRVRLMWVCVVLLSRVVTRLGLLGMDVQSSSRRGRRRFRVSAMVQMLSSVSRSKLSWMASALAGVCSGAIPLDLARAQTAAVPANQPAEHAPTEPAAVPVSKNIWTAADIQVEQARCHQLLKGLDVVARPVAPMREQECGAAAPMELISVGKNPQVTFFPPVTVTCDLAAALHRWITKDVQTLARQHLGAHLVRVDTMSSYSCRTAYGRKNARLSEHGRANALDIRSFTAANGNTSDVLVDWGPTGSEISAQVAAAKKLDAQRTLATAKQTTPGRPQAEQGVIAAAPNSGIATGSIPQVATGLADLTRPTISLGGRGSGTVGIPLPSSSGAGLGISTGIGAPSRLGGPKDGGEATIVAGRTDFLRGAHGTACRIFGTVLGPEANAAHRNHFHVDMAERKLRSICE